MVGSDVLRVKIARLVRANAARVGDTDDEILIEALRELLSRREAEAGEGAVVVVRDVPVLSISRRWDTEPRQVTVTIGDADLLQVGIGDLLTVASRRSEPRQEGEKP